MKTIITDEYGIDEVAQLIQAGEVVAFPTETVYGLGANALDEQAVKKIFLAKGRPNDNPLNVLVASKESLLALVEQVPPYIDKLIDAFSPGPITYILPSAKRIAKSVSAHLPTVGVRIPDHPIALAILNKAQVPIAAPSANTSGKPSPTTSAHVIQDLNGKIAAIVNGGTTNHGLESTVVDCTGEIPIILRSGMITAEQIKTIVGTCDVAPNVVMPSHKYKHYAPDVPLYVTNSEEQFHKLIKVEKSVNKRVGVIVSGATIFESEQVAKVYMLGNEESDMARNLYDVLRSINKSDVDVVISAGFSSKVIMDRLTQAATNVN